MQNSSNYLDNIRIEIAVLQENITCFKPATAKFRIPTLMTEDTVYSATTGYSHIINRRNGNIGASTVNIENSIDLYVPFEYTFAYGSEDRIVPSGTKFLVCYVGANVNDCKIIGRYDSSVDDVSKALASYIMEIIGFEDNNTNIQKNLEAAINELKAHHENDVVALTGLINQNHEESLSKIDALTTRLDTTDSNLAATNEALNTAKNQLSSAISKEINDRVNAIDSLRMELNQNIDNAVDEINSTIDSLEEKHITDINEIKEILDDLLKDGGTLDSAIRMLREEFQAADAALDERLTAVETDVNTLKTDTGTLKTDVEGLKTTTTELVTKTSSLDERATALETTTDDLKTRTSKLEEDTEVLKSRTVTLEEDAEELKGRMTTTETNLSTLTGNFNTLKTDYNDLKEDYGKDRKSVV